LTTAAGHTRLNGPVTLFGDAAKPTNQTKGSITMQANQTAAEKAVFHIIRRVQSCPDFAWLMIGTESLFLCLQAAAQFKGEPVEGIRKKIEANAASLKRTPEVVELRKKVQELQNAADDDDEIEEENEGYFAALLGQIQDLLWQAECGQLPLTADRLRAVLDGKPVTHLV
jgi:hypothetical protein